MIGMLEGLVALKNNPHIILNVSGVGYKILVSSSLFNKLLLQSPLILFIHTHVREDALELFGFETAEDLKLFEYLISVSGVGGKTALGVFSVGSKEEIVDAIVKGNVSFFTAIPRLGKKNAQKIIIELKNKLGGLEDLDLRDTGRNEKDEAIAALLQFGYSEREADTAVTAVSIEGISTEEIVKRALKHVGKGK